PSRTTHNTLLEVLWTVIPVVILVVIAVPSFRLLFFQLNTPKSDLTIKATGKQWYWSYAYPDSKFEFDSIMLSDADRKKVQPEPPRLLGVDNEMVVPVNKVVRMHVIGADVIHAFTVPSFGIKIDAIPGRLNETWFKATREGVYYGQCSELCGKDHAFMPIAVRVVSEQAFTAWVEDAKKKFARMDDAEPKAIAAASGNERRAEGNSQAGDNEKTSKDLIMATAATAHDTHGAGDAHDHPHGWRRFVYSTNHKDIGTMYLVFAICAGIIGGALSVAMRMELQ